MPIKLDYPRLLDRLLMGAAFVVALAILSLSDWHGEMFAENGTVEIAQLAVLSLAIAFFVRAAFKFTGWGAVVSVGLAALSTLAFVRETPRCTSPFYEYGPCFSDALKDGAYIGVGVLILGLVFANRSLRPRYWTFAQLRDLPTIVYRCLPLLSVFVLLVLADISERQRVGWLEEVLELVAYVALALFALGAAQASDRIAHDRVASCGKADPCRPRAGV